LGRVITDAKELLNHFIDPRACPDGSTKTMMLGTLFEFDHELAELFNQ
jgi:hypothetical protein